MSDVSHSGGDVGVLQERVERGIEAFPSTRSASLVVAAASLGCPDSVDGQTLGAPIVSCVLLLRTLV